MKKLYKFKVYVSRMGDIESVFIADSAEVDAAVGQSIHFGEVLGKFSDIRGKSDWSQSIALLGR